MDVAWIALDAIEVHKLGCWLVPEMCWVQSPTIGFRHMLFPKGMLHGKRLGCTCRYGVSRSARSAL